MLKRLRIAGGERGAGEWLGIGGVRGSSGRGEVPSAHRPTHSPRQPKRPWSREPASALLRSRTSSAGRAAVGRL